MVKALISKAVLVLKGLIGMRALKALILEHVSEEQVDAAASRVTQRPCAATRGSASQCTGTPLVESNSNVSKPSLSWFSISVLGPTARRVHLKRVEALEGHLGCHGAAHSPARAPQGGLACAKMA